MHEIEFHPSSPVSARVLAAALVPLGLAARDGVIHFRADDAATQDSLLRSGSEPLVLAVPSPSDLACRRVVSVLRELERLGYVPHEEGEPEPISWADLLPDRGADELDASVPGEVFAQRAVLALRDIRALRAAFAVDEELHEFTARLRTEAAPRIGTTSLARARVAAAQLSPALAMSLAFRTASGETLPLRAPTE
jgi:hypothetical protein